MRDIYNMSFAIFKGCDGSLNTNYYLEHKAAAKAAALPWGMYIWLYPRNRISLDAQVAAWWARYNQDVPPLGLYIDAEWTTYAGQAANPSAADLRAAHDKWFVKSGTRAITYTAKGYADQYLKGFDWTREELWVAHYNVSSPVLPTGARGYTFWQFTSTLDGKALDPNGNAELDGNYYNGTAEQFNQRFGGSPPVPPPPVPPPTGDKMIYINKVTVASLNGRSAPDAGQNNVVIVLLRDDIIVCDNERLAGGAYWRRVRTCIRAGVKVSLPAGEIWASDGSSGTLQGELDAFATPVTSDLSSLNVRLVSPVSLQFYDSAGASVVAEYGADVAAELIKK